VQQPESTIEEVIVQDALLARRACQRRPTLALFCLSRNWKNAPIGLA
jgi:hypothetical protein